MKKEVANDKPFSHLDMTTDWTPGQVLYCSSELAYRDAIQKAGDKLVVVDCFAEWYAML